VANVDTGRPVDPEVTIWRIGSISKTMTALAVVELASQGRIHLSGDVNSYVTSLEVPETYPLPITVADLLMHTSGLDEIRPGTQAPSAGEVLPLADFLRPRLVRIRPPGQVTAYSTYGSTVAGALVEDVTGKTIESVLRELIWQPLAMTRTSIDASKNPDVAMGYERKGESLEPQAWEWYHTTPASSVNSTAADMARYMISLLEKGDSTLLRQHITMHPRIEGVTLGLFEGFVGDLRFVEHGGNMAGFSAQMTLIPSERIGFFVVNHMEGSQLRNSVSSALIDHLFPPASTAARPRSRQASISTCRTAIVSYSPNTTG
jgi:CubicO group peptidase (beta-lactamase class C family)